MFSHTGLPDATVAARITLLRQAIERRPDALDLHVDLAEALAQDGQTDEAIRVFRRAVDGEGRWRFPPLALARALANHGIVASDIIAGLVIAESRAGNVDAVKRLVDYERFFSAQQLGTPAGFDPRDFHATLIDALKADLTFYDTPANHATRQSWRNDAILHSQNPAWLALIALVWAALQHYVDSLPEDASHPFLAARPTQMGLQGWALLSRATSYVKPHYHHGAWATAVYYVACAPQSLEPGSTKGWLHVGPPDDFGPLVGWGERKVAPAPGTLVIMPGYFFHSTEPSGVDDERVCVVLDIASGSGPQARA